LSQLELENPPGRPPGDQSLFGYIERGASIEESAYVLRLCVTKEAVSRNVDMGHDLLDIVVKLLTEERFPLF